MPKDFRSMIIEAVEEGRFNWETVAREFIMYSSQDDCEEVFDTLIENY